MIMKMNVELLNSEQLYLEVVCCKNNKNYEKAVTYWKIAAEQWWFKNFWLYIGHPDAQYELGVCYSNGKGVNKDLQKAFTYYERAAKQGHVVAKYSLGICFARGLGVDKDIK